ncbi:MAG: pitrilysin family protein, partial [Ignavibacteria bacterium]|nr:pitrilysin family protein [Ignavibacteria bacterium]
ELEEAIDVLGASVTMSTGKESIVIRANTLASKLDQTYALVEEILLEPRWDEKEFERIKKETIETINRRNVNPSVVASNVYNRLLYGSRHILSYSTLGTPEYVDEITIDDLKNYYHKNFSPSVSHIAIVGDVSEDEAKDLFSSLDEKWHAKDVKFTEYPDPPNIEKAKLYFVNVPNAKQSQIRIGYLALPYTHPDYYATNVMNYKLGGSFNGFLNLILREEKGYTYGARSRFSGTEYPGPFTAYAGVRSNVTFESMQIFKDELTRYRRGLSDEDFAFTKSALIQSNARRFETLNTLRGMLDQIATYDLPFDYVKKREEIVQEMTIEQHKALAEKYITPDKMVYLVVGDAGSQLKPLKKLGLGDPIVLGKDGNPVQ